jgi:hypothetical protein
MINQIIEYLRALFFYHPTDEEKRIRNESLVTHYDNGVYDEAYYIKYL